MTQEGLYLHASLRFNEEKKTDIEKKDKRGK